MSASTKPGNTDPKNSEKTVRASTAGLMRREIIRLRTGRRPPDDAALEASRALYQRRSDLRATLKLDYPESLPIAAHAEAITNLIRDHQVVIVAGETGSGKTTQLPKICLAAGLGITGSIAHTQPRRLPARTVASRIAQETGSPLGEAVGYAVRFTDRTNPQTLVKLVTDGLLLTEIRGDRFLDAYDAIIVDEAHERSLNIDFLLGYLRRLLARRRDLKLIVTSATIDVERFSAYFGGAPVVQVSGRGYPVDIRHLNDDEASMSEDPEETLCRAVETISTLPGAKSLDTLIFQTGEREIFESARALRARFGEKYEILPLYARLRTADQNRVFAPAGRRRLVLATNVAETSLTVPNIGFVIDPGLARINRYSYRSKLTRLPIEPVSQASANQRSGRCGRIAPGICLRLFSETDFKSRPDFTEPEIRRVNLASVVLQMRAFALGDIETFGFIEPPDPGAIRDAQRLLYELGALDGDHLTETGRAMARLPVDPRLARMLVNAKACSALREVLIIVSGLSIQDPRERPRDAQQAADQKHAQWQDPNSDFLSWVKLWEWLANLHDSSTRAGERKAHEQNFLSHMRIREWRELHRQLLTTIRDLGWRINEATASAEDVHRAIISGSLSLVGTHDEKGVFLGARGSRFRIFPGSGLKARSVRWLVAAEIAETSQVYARCVAPVEARWIEEAGEHLVTRNHSEPRWDERRGEARINEAVRLYGLPLAEKRSVRLAPIDHALARELLIRDGLVAGAVPELALRQIQFIAVNVEEQRQVLELETRARRRDLVIPEAEICAFYSERLPADVNDVTTLLRWWRSLDAKQRQSLFFDKDFIHRNLSEELGETQYPSELRVGNFTFDLKYHFAPGAEDDGVNVLVPEGLLSGVVPELLDWSVPGYFPRVVESWLRTLPKAKRRDLSPIADRVDGIAQFLQRPDRYRAGRLTRALADALHALHDLTVSEADWDRTRVDANCLINVMVLDAAGKVLRQSRDVSLLLAQTRPTNVAEDLAAPVRENLRAFPAEGLGESVTLIQRGAPVLAWPALKDRGTGVDLVHPATQSEAQSLNRSGFARLALLSQAETSRFLRKELDKEKTLSLHFASIGDAQTLRDEVLKACAWQCFFEGRNVPRTTAEFDARIHSCAQQLLPVFRNVVEHLGAILAARFELAKLIDSLTTPVFAPALKDVRQHLAELVPKDVLSVTSGALLAEIPRYLQAEIYRLRNLQGRISRDAEKVKELAAFSLRISRYAQHRLANMETSEALAQQLEEVRVGVFAEPLAKKGLGSPVKLDRAILVAEQSIGLR